MNGDFTFTEKIEKVRSSVRGSEIRDALIGCLDYLNAHINVDPPTNCPNCGAAVTGKSACCEYCGTMLIWKGVK